MPMRSFSDCGIIRQPPLSNGDAHLSQGLLAIERGQEPSISPEFTDSGIHCGNPMETNCVCSAKGGIKSAACVWLGGRPGWRTRPDCIRHRQLQ